MTANFSHFKKLEVDPSQTAELVLHSLEGAPVLIMVPAMEGNKGYFNATLKSSRKYSRAMKNVGVSAEMVEETRDQDRELYPQFVIVGWRNVLDSKGKNVPFTKEDCKGFLEALPNWLFEEVREYATTPANFLDAADAMADGSTTAKNSPSG